MKSTQKQRTASSPRTAGATSRKDGTVARKAKSTAAATRRRSRKSAAATRGKSATNNAPSQAVAAPNPAAESALAERALIDRCLTNEAIAWEELYRRYHGPLVMTIRSRLRYRRHDASLVDEIAAIVWFALVSNRGELLNRFDPARGCRLLTFLSEVVRDQMSRHFRTERRRRNRERESAIRQPAAISSRRSAAEHAPLALAEFVATLTPSERSFYEQTMQYSNTIEGQPAGNDDRAVDCNGSTNHEGGANSNGRNGQHHNGNGGRNGVAVHSANGKPKVPAAYSDSNRWQLRHRVRKKLVRFLNGSL